MNFTKEQIDYYKSKALFLSKPFALQYEELYMLGDCITDDIANDWIESDIPLLEEMVKYGAISYKAVEFYKEILENFSIVSLNGTDYNNVIWSLDGLRSHDFWENQRSLAKKFLGEFVKTNI